MVVDGSAAVQRREQRVRCSPASCACIAAARPTTALAVQYRDQPSAGGENDYEPLSGEVIIPAGASTAHDRRHPEVRQDSPAPIHVHRTSVLTSTWCRRRPDYTLGAASKAIGPSFRFDIAVFECVRRPSRRRPPRPSRRPHHRATPPRPRADRRPTAPARPCRSPVRRWTVELSGIAWLMLALGFAACPVRAAAPAEDPRRLALGASARETD